MDEIWERAVETALDGEGDYATVKTLTLDGAVKCVHGKLPTPAIFEKFVNIEQLSLANIGVSSLEQFPKLRNLQKLILSDNRIAGGLEFLVSAGLNSLRDLDLSNNRIQDIEDLQPLAELRLVSLDLYECPVTRVKDYRSRVFGLIKSVKYLDKMDNEGNERPESDDEEDEEEEEEDDDPGSGEVDGEAEDRAGNGRRGVGSSEGVVDVDEEESDADEEEMEVVTTRGVNGSKQAHSNGFRVEAVGNEDDDDEEDDDFAEEIDEDGDEEDDDVVEVHEVEDSDEEEVEDDDEDDEDDDDDDDDDEDEEEVDNDDGNGDLAEPGSTGRLTSTEGEIDGHEQGEDDEDDDGETGEEEEPGVEEEEPGVEEEGDFDEEEAEDEEEDNGTGYLVQPVGQVEVEDAEGSDVEPVNGDEDPDLEEEDEEDDYGEVQELPPSSSSNGKRKRDGGDGDDGEEDAKSPKHR